LTVFRRKSPLAVDMTNTGIADGAVTALSRMSRRATPPAAWQFAAIWANSVVPLRSRVSARQICPLVAVGARTLDQEQSGRYPSPVLSSGASLVSNFSLPLLPSCRLGPFATATALSLPAHDFISFG